VASKLARRQVVHPRPEGTAATPRKPLTRAPDASAPRPRPAARQVSGDIEVKGQIKLQCKTVAGKPFVVVRSFQLTQKKGGKYEFKALDQTISTVNEQGQVRWSG
jgi:hypothetical protein